MPPAPTPPYSYAQPGFEGLIEHIGTDPQGDDLHGNTARVQRVEVAFGGQVLKLIVRTAEASYERGSRQRLRERAAALYLHIGHRALEQVLTYNLDMVVTRSVEAAPLDSLPLELVRAITREHLEAYYQGLTEACVQPLGLDEKPGNTLFDPVNGLTAIDYHRGVGTPGTAEGLFGTFVNNTLSYLASNASSPAFQQAWGEVTALAEAVLAEHAVPADIPYV